MRVLDLQENCSIERAVVLTLSALREAVSGVKVLSPDQVRHRVFARMPAMSDARELQSYFEILFARYGGPDGEEVPWAKHLGSNYSVELQAIHPASAHEPELVEVIADLHRRPVAHA